MKGMDPPPRRRSSGRRGWRRQSEAGPALGLRSSGWDHGECSLERGHRERDAGLGQAMDDQGAVEPSVVQGLHDQRPGRLARTGGDRCAPRR